MNERAFAERTAMWEKWHGRFWSHVTSRIGDSISKNGYSRQFDDVCVMLDFRDNEGLMEFGVCVAPDPEFPCPTLPGYSFAAYWDREEPEKVAEAIAMRAFRLRDNPVSRFRRRRRPGPR